MLCFGGEEIRYARLCTGEKTQKEKRSRLSQLGMSERKKTISKAMSCIHY